MLKARAIAAIVASGLLTSGSAFAFNWTTNYRNVNELRLSGGKDAYEINFTTALTSANDNPLGCTDNTWAEPDPSMSAAQKELISKSILAAVMANKMIKLHIKESGSCINNRPVYVGVRFTR